MDRSETIREFIRAQFKANFDFTNKDVRQKAFRDYCLSKEGKDAGLDYQKHRTLFTNCFVTVCAELGKDSTMYGLSRKKVHFQSPDDSGTATIRPKPKGFKQSQNSAPSPEIKNDKTNSENVIDDSGVMVWTPELVGISLNTGYGLLQKKWTDLLPLSPEEKATLGEAWKPLFDKYLSKNWGLWGMPIIVTLGILKGKFDDAKLGNPNKTEEKKDEKVEQKPDTNVSTDEDSKKAFEEWKRTHNQK